MAHQPEENRPPGAYLTPPPVRDRRRFRRRLEDRLAERDRLRTALAAALAICGGLVVLYLFFGLLGTINFGDAAVASVVAAVLALIWVIAYWYRMRSGAAMAQRRDRERRGF